VESQAVGDGCNGPDEYLIRADYALDGREGCIAQARRHAAALLDRAGDEHRLPMCARVKDLTLLVVSELVTNACKYAPGPVLMELRVNARVVDVAVWDADPVLPTAQLADPGRIGQHGLEIVAAATETLLMEQKPDGKRITARLALSAAPAGSPLT
jgi:two-component sensor histidine kinase